MSNHLSEETLNAYLDELLAIETSRQVEAHLSTCTVCHEQVVALRQLFFDLDLPDLPLEKDFSKLVLQKIRPTVVLPRWQWAVWGQFGLSLLLLVIAWPTFIQSKWFIQVQPFSNMWTEPFATTGAFFSQISQMTNAFLLKFLETFQAIQAPELPFSLFTVSLILVATGALWLVGNGLLLKNQN